MVDSSPLQVLWCHPLPFRRACPALWSAAAGRWSASSSSSLRCGTQRRAELAAAAQSRTYMQRSNPHSELIAWDEGHVMAHYYSQLTQGHPYTESIAVHLNGKWFQFNGLEELHTYMYSLQSDLGAHEDGNLQFFKYNTSSAWFTHNCNLIVIMKVSDEHKK